MLRSGPATPLVLKVTALCPERNGTCASDVRNHETQTKHLDRATNPCLPAIAIRPDVILHTISPPSWIRIHVSFPRLCSRSSRPNLPRTRARTRATPSRTSCPPGFRHHVHFESPTSTPTLPHLRHLEFKRPCAIPFPRDPQSPASLPLLTFTLG
jgi:hypothetical protein